MSILLLCLPILSTPRVAEAQQAGKVWRIGFLYSGSRQSSVETGRYNAFLQGMRELGYLEGKNLVVEGRFAGANTGRLPDLAAELVRLKVDVIVATGTPANRAAQRVTAAIPIVMTVSGDAQRGGFPINRVSEVKMMIDPTTGGR